VKKKLGGEKKTKKSLEDHVSAQLIGKTYALGNSPGKSEVRQKETEKNWTKIV